MNRIRKGVIPAAGLGTRMHPVARGQPKEMLQIGGKPMIWYAVFEAAWAGLEGLYIVVNERKKALRRYLESEEMERDLRAARRENRISCPELTFVDQPASSGSGEAIYRVRELVGEEPFALMMPDFVFFGRTPALGQMMPLYERSERDTVGVLAVGAKEAEGFGNVGIIEGRELEPRIWEVQGLSNKSREPLILKQRDQILKAVGRWMLGSNFFSYLERTTRKGEEWDDTPALQLICEEREVLGKVLEGRGFDVGNPLGYRAAKAFADAQLDAEGEKC